MVWVTYTKYFRMNTTTESTVMEELLASPFYVYPSESPSLQLTIIILAGNNFYSWFRAMKMVLITKNKLEFVDGTI